MIKFKPLIYPPMLLGVIAKTDAIYPKIVKLRFGQARLEKI